MERFHYGERVQIVDPVHHLYGRIGTVIQVRPGDGMARVKIERGLEPEQCLWLEGVMFRDEVLLFPNACVKLGR